MTPKEKAVIDAADKYEKAQVAYNEAAENGMDGSERDTLLKAHDALMSAIREWRAFALTADHMRQIMPNLPTAKLDLYMPHLVAAMAKYEINTPLRAAAFLAQLAHESGEFRWMEEIWGANGGTAQQKKYEPPSDLAKTLGNTEKGDGYRYRGRGVIMITGRSNYKKYGDLLGVDLVGNPDLAAQPEYAFQIAGAYWKMRGLNELADGNTENDFRDITIRINGGVNGLTHREAYYEKAKKALGLEVKGG